MNKKLEKNIKRILYGVLTIIILLPIFIPIYIFIRDHMVISKLEKNLYFKNIYKKVGKYYIGKQVLGPLFGGESVEKIVICNMEEKECLNWTIRGITINNDYIYTYIYDSFISKIEYEKVIRGKDYPMSYSIWGDDYTDTPESIEDLKQFGVFTQTSMNFYSLNELDILTEEQKDILLDLKERPRFIFE